VLGRHIGKLLEHPFNILDGERPPSSLDSYANQAPYHLPEKMRPDETKDQESVGFIYGSYIELNQRRGVLVHPLVGKG